MMLLMWMAQATARVENFEGAWRVTELHSGQEPDSSSMEIKYPKIFQLKLVSGSLEGTYADQFGNECSFALVTVFNGGNDLLLIGCGSTKESGSYAPIHHVKLKNNKLIGVVTTNDKLFEWVAERQRLDK